MWDAGCELRRVGVAKAAGSCGENAGLALPDVQETWVESFSGPNFLVSPTRW